MFPVGLREGEQLRAALKVRFAFGQESVDVFATLWPGPRSGAIQQRDHRLIQCIALFGAVQGDFCDTICYIQKGRVGHA